MARIGNITNFIVTG